MRFVATLAAMLALPCALFADEPETPDIHIPAAAAAAELPAAHAPADLKASGKYDTSVYHLKHARARQIIPAVRQAVCKGLAAKAQVEPPVHSVVSVVFVPTTDDDALVAICPREQAEIVKQAIEECDVEKQYAVRVQLFEVSPNGDAVQVGDPAVVVGREGSVVCKAAGDCPVTLKLQLSDGTATASVTSQASVKEPAAGELAEEPCCCGPDCGQADAECPCGKIAGPLTCNSQTPCNGQTLCNGQTPAECTCPASCGQCASCEGTCCATKQTIAGPCGCKVILNIAGLDDSRTVRVLGAFIDNEHSHVLITKSQGADCKCGASCKCGTSCKCGSSCKCGNAASCDSESAVSCGGTCAGACEQCAGSCALSPELTADEYKLLVKMLVSHWAQEHEVHAGIGREVAAPGEIGECCPGGGADTCPLAPAEKLGVKLGCPAAPPSSAEGPSAEETSADSPATSQLGAPGDLPPVPNVAGTQDFGRLFLHQVHVCPGGVVSSCPDESNDDVAVMHVTDADTCECAPGPCGGSCPAQHSEPPALLTLSARKDGAASLGILVAPQWQAELAKIYQGRRLSEIFEPHNGQDAGAAALGRLLADIPKPCCESEGDNSRHRNVIVIDMPDRIRVFESPAEPACAAAAACPNCPDQFRAFLEGIVRGSSVLEEITQAGHAEYDEAVAKSPRDLPSVAQSKLETKVVTYPLRDLILLDEADHPVFDTCAIVDHIQSAVAPESWWHPSVSIQLDQQSMSLVVRQTPDVHKKIEAHLRDLRRLQVKHLCNLIERLSAEPESSED